MREPDRHRGGLIRATVALALLAAGVPTLCGQEPATAAATAAGSVARHLGRGFLSVRPGIAQQ